jgi:hypothetical protein
MRTIKCQKKGNNRKSNSSKIILVLWRFGLFLFREICTNPPFVFCIPLLSVTTPYARGVLLRWEK